MLTECYDVCLINYLLGLNVRYEHLEALAIANLLVVIMNEVKKINWFFGDTGKLRI